MPFVSVTRLHLRSTRFLPPFLMYAFRSARQAQKSAGFLGGRLMRDQSKAFWTLTVWSDGKAMEAYRIAGMHLAAMPKLLDWCDEASLAHWTPDSARVPDWEECCERMVQGGRPSKVNHPSAAHRAFQIPALVPTRFSGDLPPLQRSA
jgi:Domain of unknown function (DUF3291)